MDDEQAGAVDVAPSPGPAPGLALGVGAVSTLVGLLALNPLLVNLEGPFGEHAALGLLASLVLALVVGAVIGLVTHVVGSRSAWGVVVLLAALAGLVVVAFPTRVDRHESFVEQPNERSSCVGVTFSHYPPGTFDASSDVYCVGLERPMPAGWAGERGWAAGILTGS